MINVPKTPRNIITRKKNQGIALIQVLIIAIVLAMLGIYINQTVRSQIAVVNLMKESFELSLALENAEAKLLHNLLTNTRYRKNDSENSLIQKWNFHGEPFNLNENTTVTIQDLSGLLSLNILSNSLTTNLFKELGFTGHEVRTFVDALADWKDKDTLKRLNGAEKEYYQSINQVGPRNHYVQFVPEVEQIKQSNLLTPQQWERYFSTAFVPNFNPLNAPNTLLKAFLNNDIAYQSILAQRKAGTLSGFSFYQASAINSGEFINFSTGSYLRVTLLVTRQKNKLSKEFIVDLRPSSFSRPIIISQLTWNQV